MKSSLRQTAAPQHRSRGKARRHPKTPSAGKHPRRRFLGLAVGVAAFPAVSRFAWAQTYPSRPITMVVPVAPGGATDVIGRMMAERMKSSLGQPVIVENVTGAGGTIAVGRVARAAPDGYTLSLGNNGSHVSTGAMYAVHYDLLNDFEPVGLLTTGPLVLVARKTFPANDLKGLIAWLKANPDKATEGYTGNAGGFSIVGLFLQRETGTRYQFVPYRGGAGQYIQDLVAGQIDLASDRRRASRACRHDQCLWSHHQDPAGLRA